MLWEGTSCVAASAIVCLQWRRLHRLDHLLLRAATDLARRP